MTNLQKKQPKTTSTSEKSKGELKQSTKPSSSTSDSLLEELRANIAQDGFEYDDPKFFRKVKSVRGYGLGLTREELKHFDSIDLPVKYNDDHLRMMADLDRCAREAKKDPNSRQLIAYNPHVEFLFPCFNFFQFLKGKDGKFILHVYQRSQELGKWKEDIAFFNKLINIFEVESGHEVADLKIIYGDLHYETEK